MTKLDAIQQKIDAAKQTLADATTKVVPLTQAEADARNAYLRAQDDEAHYTTARMNAEITYRTAQAAHQAGQQIVTAATAEVTRWQAAWEKTLEE
jgi:hypothetical protein